MFCKKAQLPCDDGGILYGEFGLPMSQEFMVGNCILCGDIAFIQRAQGSATKWVTHDN